MHTSPMTWLRRAGAVAALVATAACHPAAAAQDSCAQPPDWPAPGAKAGQPDVELGACLKAQAWKIRGLTIPTQSAVAGIIAQCEIQVDQMEGGPPADQSAREPPANQIATAAVGQYRQCPAR
jgi:hypothetical protein